MQGNVPDEHNVRGDHQKGIVGQRAANNWSPKGASKENMKAKATMV